MMFNGWCLKHGLVDIKLMEVMGFPIENHSPYPVAGWVPSTKVDPKTKCEIESDHKFGFVPQMWAKNTSHWFIGNGMFFSHYADPPPPLPTAVSMPKGEAFGLLAKRRQPRRLRRLLLEGCFPFISTTQIGALFYPWLFDSKDNISTEPRRRRCAVRFP